MYVESVLENSHLRIFTDVFEKATEICNYATRLSLQNSVKITQPKTETYGRYSIKHQCATSWNNLLTHINIDMVTESGTKVKDAQMNYFLSTYNRDLTQSKPLVKCCNSKLHCKVFLSYDEMYLCSNQIQEKIMNKLKSFQSIIYLFIITIYYIYLLYAIYIS